MFHSQKTGEENRMKLLLNCIAIVCAGLAARGAVVNAHMGPRWSAVTNAAPVLAWDWAWEWVPASAAKARVVVSGGRNGVVHDQTYVRPSASAAISLPAVSAKTEDVYFATIEFQDAGGAALASKTAQLDVLCGAFPAVGVEVRTAGLDERKWERSASSRAIVPYPAGYAVVHGKGRVLLEYLEPGAAEPAFSQYVAFPIPGFTMMVW